MLPAQRLVLMLAHHPEQPLCERGHAGGRPHELDALAQLARSSTEAEFETAIRERLGEASDTAGYLKSMPPETLYAGLDRYWSKRDEA